jgi:hypothetical protein
MTLADAACWCESGFVMAGDNDVEMKTMVTALSSPWRLRAKPRVSITRLRVGFGVLAGHRFFPMRIDEWT